MKKRIILATTSPRRHGLAQQMGLEFNIVPSNYEENIASTLHPKELAMALAYGKAADVASRYKEGIVIRVDTFIVFNGKVIGKPKTKEKAYSQLKKVSGKIVKVYSGVTLIDCKSKKVIRDYEVSDVKFKKLTNEEIKNYIKTGEPLDKAGAFAIQGLGSIFIEKVNGCYANIVGFPINNIYKNLKKLGVNIFEYKYWKGY